MSMIQIEIRDLDVSCRIGVPEEERRQCQRLLISLRLWIPHPAADDVQHTVDYAAVAVAVRAEAIRHPRQLIETLASDIGQAILTSFSSVRQIEVEIKKFILPSTRWVAVKWQAERP